MTFFTREEKKAVLIDAKRLIAEVGWTRGNMAVRGGGNACIATNFGDPDASAFCLAGAINRAAANYNYEILPELWIAAQANMLKVNGVPLSIVLWNDTMAKSKDDVLAFLDKVIASV